MVGRKTWIAGVLTVAVLAGLLAGAAAQEKSRDTRLAGDPTSNHFPALQDFLKREKYGQEDIQAVLGPLEGQLSRGYGTPDAHLVESLDDIRGLRPLPEGLVEFLHGRHNVFYLAVGSDRLLLGISSRVIQQGGKPNLKSFHFEKFDLIDGHRETVSAPQGGWARFGALAQSRGPYLGFLLVLLVLGAVVIRLIGRRGG